MKLLNNYLKSNTFIYRSGKIQAISKEVPNDVKHGIDKSLLPIVIIAREHYQEFKKLYPVPDKADVKNIIENEFSNLKLYDLQSEDLTSYSAKLYIFDEQAELFINNNTCLFLPETMLSNFLNESELTTVNRLGTSLNLIRKSSTVYSSSGLGLYQDPDLFLFSSGAGEADSKLELEQEPYFDQLLSQLVCLDKPDLLLLLSGQQLHKKILKSLHLQSLVAGISLSLLVYWMGLFGHLHWLQNYKEEESSREEVKNVIALQRQLNEKVSTVNDLDGAVSKSVMGNMLWEIVAELLENDVSVSTMIYESQVLQLGMLAPSAADTVALIRSMSNVGKVTIDGDIFDMDGKQNVRVVIELNEEGNDD